MSKQGTLFNEEHLRLSATIMRAVANNVRIKILAFIDTEGETPVSPIYQSLGLEQSMTSAHLKILRNAGIVKTHRDGRQVVYSIDYEKLNKVKEAISILAS